MTWPTKTDFVDGDVLTAAQVNNIGTNLNVFNPTSATNGQLWVANGSGGGAYTTVATGSYTLLASGSLPTGSGTLTLSSISSAYEALRLVMFDWSSASATEINVRINNITSSSYFTGYLFWADTAYTQNKFAGTYMPMQNFANTAAGTMTTVLDFPVYSTNTKQVIIGTTLGTATGATSGIGNAIGQYTTSTTINRIDVYLASGNYDAGTYELYGLK